MQVTETKNEGLSREYTVSIPATTIDAKVTDRLAEMAKTASMPGFRPGKVPASVLKKKYGQNVMGEALELSVNEAIQQVVKDNNLRPAIQPKVEIIKFEEGEDLECSLAVDVIPEIKLMDFSKIKLEREVVEAEESEVTTALEKMADAYKTSTAISEKRKAASGDVAVIDFVGSVDGEEFPGGKAEGYPLELGTGNFIPGFEEQIIGHDAGDAFDVNVSFPADYNAEELAGKDALFKVTLNEIQENKPSAIDDELAKKAGMENLDALKQAIRDQHNSGYKGIARQKMKRQLLDMLDEEYTFDLPPALLESEYEGVIKQVEEARKQGQVPEEDGKSEAELDTEYHEIAARRVRLGLLFTEIGHENKIEIEQADINAALMEEAKQYPGQEQQVIEFYQKNPEAMQALSGPIFEEKVTDFILELVSTTDKKVTQEELFAMDDGAKPKKKAAKKKAATKKTDKK